ncbi:Ionotropic receptor 197 [Hyalella azteca]|uniref:Ionotropic receptor 197 n=1 Tax=Hyalella azteca TaxID=294128 RepID=A0A6A0H5A5_HYAAZ|nr:Ionotropic receptor 197 [Hyalella azteca]
MLTIIIYNDTDDVQERLVLRLLRGIAGFGHVGVVQLSDAAHSWKPVKDQQQFLVFWNTRNGSIYNFLLKAGSEWMFSEHYQWLILLPEDLDPMAWLGGLRLYVNNEVVFCQPQAGGKFQLFEAWTPGDGFSFRKLDVAEWRPQTGMRFYDVGYKYDRRRDLGGFFFLVTTGDELPGDTEINHNVTTQNFLRGYSVDLWHVMQQRLNFTYKVRKTLFGVLQPDQVTWNGMVGELQASRAHVGIAPLRITTFRQRAIDYTIPTKVLQNRIYLRQPDVEASWNLYAEPFNAILWTCVLGFIFVVALSARLLHVVAARAHLTNEVVSSSDVFFDAFASLVQQSGTLNPETSSERLLWFFVYWTSVLLFTSYSAVLIALLTTVRPTLPFTDFESLLLRPDWNLVIVQNRALSDYLALAPEGSTLKKVWDKHVMSDPAKNRPVAMDAAVALVLQGKHALLVAEETMAVAMHMMPKEDAFKIIHTGKYFFNSPAAFSVPKNSPYLELFNHVLSRMRESGQMGRLLNKWNRELVQPPSDIYPSPGLTETFVLFLVLGVGILVSCGILISERIIVARSAPRATRPPSLDHSTTWVPTTARPNIGLRAP